MDTEKRIALWPEGAPGAAGDTWEDRPHLIPFLLPGRKAGCVIVCPGGGYVNRAAHEADPIARRINEFGVHAVVLHYRVAPYRYPCSLLDAQRAIRYVRAHAEEWNVLPDHIAILGFSAGGHLAATASTHYDQGLAQGDAIDRLSCRPDASVLCYGVLSFDPAITHGGSCKNLLGESPEPALVEDLSNERRVNADTPPAFLWHTAADNGVPALNSIRYAGQLAQFGVPYELHIYQDGRHGLGLAEGDPSVSTWSGLMGLWLQKRGFSTP